MRAFTTLAVLIAPVFAAAADPVTVATTSYAELETSLQKHKGKVVLVDVWSLSCTSCLKKFPSIVQLHKDHESAGLVVISLTTDEVDDKPKVLEFLTKNQATFTNLLLKDTDAAAKANEAKYPVDPQPMLWLFDRSGKRVLTDTGKLKPEDLTARVKEQLAR